MNDSEDLAADETGRFQVVASSAMTPLETFVLKRDDTFAVLDRMGDFSPEGRSEQGLYHGGTKFLSRLRLRLHGQRPLLLSSSMPPSNLQQKVDLTNADIEDADHAVMVPYGTLHLERSKFCVRDGYFERIHVSNYGTSRTRVELTLDFAASFVDVFEVRGTRRAARGKLLPALVRGSTVVLRYLGLDDVQRSTALTFSPPPAELSARRVRFDLDLAGKETWELTLEIACRVGGPEPEPPAAPRAFAAEWQGVAAALEERERQGCQVLTSSLRFNDWVERSRADLRMLMTETERGAYPYAGVPWFSTPFGRDGLLTALEMLWLEPEVARGVLGFLSAHQAQRLDPDADAEPGKILHELRGGEMANLREIPFGCYYGSIDATPLYLTLAHRYYRRTGDRDFIASIWPNLMLASEWMERYGDLDGDGFLEYGRRSKDGLIQQGWKDSNDSVFHADGELATGPVALVEVQAYKYAALLGMAELGELLERPDIAEPARASAEQLRERFDAAFFCEELGTYALALDGAKRPCRVRASNAGHALFAGIARPERAAAVGATLLSDEMFSGWGIRTLAAGERRYNPMSYHNGSIWPHDNAIVAAGLAVYGMKDAASRVLQGMFEITRFLHLHRLPELFCGFPRDAAQGPTLYPVACSPQAWASAAVFLLLKAVLGVDVDALNRRITLRHTMLPAFLAQVDIRGLRIGEATLDLRFERAERDVAISVSKKHGDVEVLAIK